MHVHLHTDLTTLLRFSLLCKFAIQEIKPTLIHVIYCAKLLADTPINIIKLCYFNRAIMVSLV